MYLLIPSKVRSLGTCWRNYWWRPETNGRPCQRHCIALTKGVLGNSPFVPHPHFPDTGQTPRNQGGLSTSSPFEGTLPTPSSADLPTTEETNKIGTQRCLLRDLDWFLVWGRLRRFLPAWSDSTTDLEIVLCGYAIEFLRAPPLLRSNFSQPRPSQEGHY